MKTLKMKLSHLGFGYLGLENLMLWILLGLSWYTLPIILQHVQPEVGLLDSGVWQLILLDVICFATIVSGVWWLLNRFWTGLGLATISNMVSQFNTLMLWQQLGFYWASFALLFLGAILSLAAIF